MLREALRQLADFLLTGDGSKAENGAAKCAGFLRADGHDLPPPDIGLDLEPDAASRAAAAGIQP